MEPRFLPLFFLIAAMPEIHAQLILPPDMAYVVADESGHLSIDAKRGQKRKKGKKEKGSRVLTCYNLIVFFADGEATSGGISGGDLPFDESRGSQILLIFF